MTDHKELPLSELVSAEFTRLRGLALEQAQDAHDWQKRAEKAEAERDQLIKAAERVCGASSAPYQGELRGELADAVKALNEILIGEALATPHTAAGMAYDAWEVARDEPSGTADSVQVRTPGTVEVCESCRNTRGLVCDERCARPECPIRPKQGV